MNRFNCSFCQSTFSFKHDREYHTRNNCKMNPQANAKRKFDEVNKTLINLVEAEANVGMIDKKLNKEINADEIQVSFNIFYFFVCLKLNYNISLCVLEYVFYC